MTDPNTDVVTIEKETNSGDDASKNGTSNAAGSSQNSELTEVITQKERDLRKKLDALSLAAGQPLKTGAKTVEEAKGKTHAFWETQPVPAFDEEVQTNEPIEADKSKIEIRNDPYSLPTGFQWDNVDVTDSKQLQELYTLLNENYVEDEDNMFRFDYSPNFLNWALKPPGWLPQWHCGVRVIKSQKLVGFIAAIPCSVRVYEHVQKMVEINFLCVHKKLRAKRVAPVLIREITRRVNLEGIFQAVYTAGVILPRPISTCRYYHRSLNPKKLIDVRFSFLGKNMTMQRTLKLYKLPETTRTEGFRQMTPADVSGVYRMLAEYLLRFDLAPIFSVDEFQHWFSPQLDVVDSYVVEKDGVVTDFVSFYTLPSTVMHHPTHKSLKAAYAFYNVSKGTDWAQLMNDCLITAKKNGYDVFNALDLMDNREFLEKLKFGIGDGNLQYYLYNWKCPEMPPNKNLLLETVAGSKADQPLDGWSGSAIILGKC